MRERIREAYRTNFNNFEDLLDACATIEEEFVYKLAPSRLDYFKQGVHYEKFVLPQKRRRHSEDGLTLLSSQTSQHYQQQQPQKSANSLSSSSESI